MDSTSLSFDLSFGNLHDPEDLRTLARLGFRTLIDTRAPADAKDGAALPNDDGMRYVSLPILDGAPEPDTMQEFVDVMSDPDCRPVFVRGAATASGVLAVVWDAIYRSLSVNDAEALARGLGVGALPEPAKAFIRAKSAAHRRAHMLPAEILEAPPEELPTGPVA